MKRTHDLSLAGIWWFATAKTKPKNKRMHNDRSSVYQSLADTTTKDRTKCSSTISDQEKLTKSFHFSYETKTEGTELSSFSIRRSMVI
jgi:hypothetical protein